MGINLHIGRRPNFAAGNSDGDLQTPQYPTIGHATGFVLIVHHTNSQHERAYDRDSHIERLDQALDDGPRHGWIVVDMKRDWKQVYRSG